MEKNIINLFQLLIIGTTLICCEKDKNKGLPVDGDGNVYATVVIGTQVWLKENLKTTKFHTGASLNLVTDPIKWSLVSGPAYCYYNNNEELKDTYGLLYNWQAARLATLCPVGWRNPTKDEWNEMIEFLGGVNIAANKLKEMGLAHWNSDNSGATNESGFTALPGGSRGWNGDFYGLERTGGWWTASNSYDNRGWDITISSVNISFSAFPVEAGKAVRCIKYQ